ncbi:WYL domain-containing protein [Oleispirillum naphthae]|uniref:WYL domain-containing protein n=1 Tax=Oleispirillum naphthae TaxID=2838853 RepID=UPI003082693E
MTATPNVRPALARRYEFIEWRAYWLGRLNRKDIEDEFGISTPQASIDINKYMEECPGNIIYNSSEKTYITSDDFTPKFAKISADRVLLHIRSILSGALDITDTWFPDLPPTATIPPITRSVDPTCLRTMLAAIRDNLEVEVEYQSLTNTRRRYIAPHSLAFDGHRWHVRAWAADKGDFRDFVLARIREIGGTRPSKARPEDDLEWSTMVTLDLVAHPDLDDAQKSAIECDFGMKDGRLRLETRLALAFYQIKRLNLDLDSSVIRPERKQLYLTNLNEINAKREAVCSATKERKAAQMP